MTGLLFGIGNHDPMTFAGVSIVFLLVAAVACLMPARRATSINPVSALRFE